MTWTYSGNPAASDKDAVRFFTQDTDSGDQLLSDEELTYLLNLAGNTISAAISASHAISVKFAKMADQTVGSISASYSRRAEVYAKMAKEIPDIYGSAPGIVVTGISVSENLAQEADSDLVRPLFKTGDFDDTTVVPPIPQRIASQD